MVRWKKKGSNDEVIAETSAYFEGLEQSSFLERLQEIEKRWN